MKELSIEQKAQRYDEALKVLHKYDGANIMFSQDLKEEMFPELAESEDEKIRKDLIIYLRSILSNKKYGDKFIENWIAWLEKLPIEKLPFEMKTPEESLGIDSDTYSKVVDECIYGEQKPNDNQFTPEQAGVLDKYIDKFLEQNRTWSEEDEQYVKDTLALLAFGVSVHTISQVQDWLNSLKDKYTWKPSDAQMASITCAVRKMKESACYDSELVSLYQDLKKL